MKYILIAAITLFSGLNILAQEKPFTYYAYAISGLKIREKPAQSSTELGKIKFGDTVHIIETDKTNPILTIDGLKGKYVLIDYNGIRGYTFSGYLSRLKAPTLNNRWSTLKDYLNEKHTKNEKQKKVEVPEPYNPGHKKKGTLQKYGAHIEFYDFGEECSYDEVLKITNLSFREAFLFISTFQANYRGVKLNTPSDKSEENKCYCANLTPKKDQSALYLSREKGVDGQFNSISICFDAEAGSGCVKAYVSKEDKNVVVIEFSYSCS